VVVGLTQLVSKMEQMVGRVEVLLEVDIHRQEPVVLVIRHLPHRHKVTMVQEI
jgi:hypothetical protein